MVASEKAIRDANWAGEIHLNIVLASNEVTTLDAPLPLYALAPRLGYFPFVAAQALEFFQDALPPGTNTPWFEYKRIPLPWQVPVGVLYDLLASNNEQPWRLTVHFRAFPSDVLLRWEGDLSLRAAYFNSLKEAAYICQGSARGVMDMALQAQNDLWDAVTLADAEGYASISSSLRMAPKARGERRPSVPLRLYVRHSHGGYIASLDSATRYTSRPVEMVSESGRLRSLREALEDLLSALCQNGTNAGSSKANDDSKASSSQQMEAPDHKSDADGQSEGAALEAASSKVAMHGEEDTSRKGADLHINGKPARALINGVSPDLDAPLAWFHANLHHADFFLYIIVTVKE